MRRILVDYARSRRYQKRGGEAQQVELNEAMIVSRERASDVIALDGDSVKDITAVRRVVFVMKGGVVYKNVARGAIPVYAGVQP